MSVRGLDHINIATPSLEESRIFYCEILGLAVGYRPAFKVPGYWLYAEGRPIVHLQNGDVAPSTQGAVRHFAFAVARIAPLLRRLDKAQIEYRRAVTPDGKTLQVFFDDPSGATVELNCAAVDEDDVDGWGTELSSD